jgi:hypothetical protein
MKSMIGRMLGGFVAGMAGLVSWVSVSAAQDASMELFCLSLRLNAATAKMLSIPYTLEFTSGSVATGEAANGELGVSDGAVTTHVTQFRLNSDTMLEPITGVMYLNVPTIGDANKNGLNDFIEPSQVVSPVLTTGYIYDDLTGSEGTVNATWSRSAGTNQGTCTLAVNTTFLRATFVHTFELPNYTGTLHYTPAKDVVEGSADLHLFSDVLATFSGPMFIDKTNANQLHLEAGAWTNSAMANFAYAATADGEYITRKGTNYLGFFDAMDGNLDTPYVDYALWTLLISDGNDANKNGVPDLSDSTDTRLPSLKITRSAGQLQLTISSTVGRVHQIENINALGGANQWTAVTNFTLATDPQTVILSTPTNKTSFWRVGME